MSRRRELLFCAAAAAALVLVRSIVPTVYEGFYFDSDQAIVGLMAKRASAFQEFPLFYSGLNYILAVEAWIITPFFWLARPSVAVMRLPLIVLNVLVAVWLVVAISRRLGLRPVMAFITALPFIIPTPATSNTLLEAAGACVEPFVYVLLLWHIRRHALAFGALLAIGSLHREFVMFAVPALFLAERAYRSCWSGVALKHAATVGLGVGLVSILIDDLKMHLTGGPLALQAASLRGQMCFDAAWGSRLRSLLTEAFPALLGGVPTRLQQIRMNTPLVTGYAAVGWLVRAALIAMVLRMLVAHPRQRNAGPDSSFGAYLMWVGALTACVYPLSCNAILGHPPILRYLTLGILLPVGLCALFLRGEPSPSLRAAIAAAFVAWAAVDLFDQVRLIRSTVANPPPNEHRVLADYLITHRIRYARATYWDAYVVDFLSRGRVIVASSDLIRIQEYQRQVDEHAAEEVLLERLPCEGGERVASWCIKRR